MATTHRCAALSVQLFIQSELLILAHVNIFLKIILVYKLPMEIAEDAIQSLLSAPHLTLCEVIHTTV